MMILHWRVIPLLLACACASTRGAPAPDAGRWVQKQFLVTFWCPPPATDAALSRVAAEGFNFTDKDGKPVDGKQYFLNLALIRLAALEANRPFLNIIQADTIEKSWRLPNASELRFLVFTTLAYGGRGISYFTYWGPPAYNGLYQDGNPAPLLGPVVALNKEINAFGPALLQLDSLAVYHTAPLPYGAEAIPAAAPVQITGPGEFVLGLFGKEGRPDAFMIVNRDYLHGAEATLKVQIPGGRLQELDRSTGQWSAGEALDASRNVQVQLGPGDGRLFRLSGRIRGS